MASHASTAPPRKTTMFVRLPPWHEGRCFASVPGLAAPDFSLWGDAKNAVEAPISIKKKEQEQAKTAIKKSNRSSVCVDALLSAGGTVTLGDAVASLRTAGWLSSTSADVVIVEVDNGKLAGSSARFSLSSALVPEKSYEVYELFNVSPCNLFRTVLQSDFYPCVEAEAGPFGAVAPVACAAFAEGEFVTDASLAPPAVRVAGLSLEGVHAGSFSAPTLSAVLNRHIPAAALAAAGAAGGAAAPVAAAPRLIACCDLAVFDDEPIAVPGAPASPIFGKLGGTTVYDATSPLPQRLHTPAPESDSTAFMCFMLPAGKDLGSLGCQLVFDSSSSKKLAHFSLIPRDPALITPVKWWDADPSGALRRPPLVTRDPSAPPTPPGSCEVFQHRGATVCPLVAGLFRAHCFKICGKMGHTEFDADEPGADADVASALEVCADLGSDSPDGYMRRLLDESLDAHYSLSRMGAELLGDLAGAFESAAHEPLSPAAAEIVARGINRLREWSSAKLGSVLPYAAGPAPVEPTWMDTTVTSRHLHPLL